VRKVLVSILIGLASAGVAALLGLLPFVQTVELKTYDLRVRATADPSRARRDIVLVTIDETSIRELEPVVGRWPWPRVIHARLLDFLARAPARVVVYDVLFSEHDRQRFKLGEDEWTGEESDRELAEAVARSGNVVLAADASQEAAATPGGGTATPAVPVPSYRIDTPIETRPVLTPPFEELARSARAIGHAFAVYDPDGPARRTVPFLQVGGRTVPSLAVAAAMLAQGIGPDAVSGKAGVLQIGRRRVPLIQADIPSLYGERRRSARALIRFTGPLMSGGRVTYQDYSFYRLFYSEYQLLEGNRPLVDPAVFRDKIVIVGTTAAGLQDLFTTPFSTGKMPGIQLHANVIDNLLSSGFIEPAPAWATALAAGAGALGVAAACVLLPVWPGLALTGVLALALAGISVWLFGRGTWLALATPSLGMALSAFSGVAYQYFVEGREKRRIKHVFTHFVARDVFDHLMADPAGVALGGARREMTVLFSDIRGFTTLTERGQPEALVSQLNEYFTRMVAVLFRHRGTLDKFVGDAVMALFGAPLEDPDHADHALAAALEMLAELEALNRRWTAAGRPRFDIGVGINAGEMVAGNIGSEQVMSYTVIGDAVNLGSRLESLNKQYGTNIIISGETRRRLKQRYDMHPLGQVVVKGKTEAVEIYEVRPDRQPARPEPGGAAQAGGAGGTGNGESRVPRRR
jgi:adenylate cyclase